MAANFQKFLSIMNTEKGIICLAHSFGQFIVDNWNKVQFRGEVCIPDKRYNPAIESDTFNTFQEVFEWMIMLGAIGNSYRLYLVADFTAVGGVRRCQVADITNFYLHKKITE